MAGGMLRGEGFWGILFWRCERKVARSFAVDWNAVEFVASLLEFSLTCSISTRVFSDLKELY
jgi:hypothetical protein